MYKKRTKISKKLAAMRKAKERIRMESTAPDYPFKPPKLRRIIVIIDFDFGKMVNIIRLYRTNRIDCYQAVVDGKIWKKNIGWSKILEGIRKSFVRVHSIY